MKKSLLLIFIFIASLCVQLLLERMGKVDSIGVWYTIFCSLIYTFSIFLIFILLKLLISKLKSNR